MSLPLLPDAHEKDLTCQYGTPVGPGRHLTCEGCEAAQREARAFCQAQIAAGIWNRRLFTKRQWVACGFRAEDWATAPGIRETRESAA
jgi:hypothetical protein